ncbi:MAG: 50S ribosomal protein L29 [Flavobacteriia bacterium]|nr:50S ribosomal protein L29 [Flavobacteriia bacterium]
MKQNEIKQLSNDDLKSRVSLMNEQYEKMKLSHKVTPLENPLQIRAMRKTIARLNTEITKRSAEA